MINLYSTRKTSSATPSLLSLTLIVLLIQCSLADIKIGRYGPPFLPLGDPSVNVDDIFKNQPKRLPSPGIFPNVSQANITLCDRLYEYYYNRTGVYSKSLLTYCLFKRNTEFKKLNLYNPHPEPKVICDNNTKTAPRLSRHRNFPVGQCCMTSKGAQVQYQCMEDQTWRDCDCASRDKRCQVKNVQCSCDADYREPVFRKIGKYMNVGVRLIAHKCFAERKSMLSSATSPGCCKPDTLTSAGGPYCSYFQLVGWNSCGDRG